MRSYMSHIALCTLSNVISLLDRSLYQAQTLYAELRMAEDRRGGGVRKKKGCAELPSWESNPGLLWSWTCHERQRC